MKPQVKEKNLTIEIFASIVITSSKIVNQNLIAIEDTSSEDSPHLFELDRIIKNIIKDTKEANVLLQKLKYETRKLPFQTKDGVESWKESIERNWEGLGVCDVVGNPQYR